LKGDATEYFVKMMAAKYKCWEYEKQWRVFREKGGTEYRYEPQAEWH